jgi:arylsulfatase A-like enzyme/Tfp pilus assembly protein PilF
VNGRACGTHRILNSVAALFCALVLVGSVLARQDTSPRSLRPDVFLITIDTVRADHIRGYGYKLIQTPALDLLAKDGITFLQAFTAAPITNASHASIMTGLLPSTHGVTNFLVPLSPVHKTWAESLKSEGYHTAAFIGAIILDSRAMAVGFDRGFDFYDNFTHQEQSGSASDVRRSGTDVVRRAEQWMKENQGTPRFVWIHLYDAHALYKPPPPYYREYQDRPYDGAVAYVDSSIGSFLAYLKREKSYDQSLIVVVADHGEGLGEHQENMHGVFLYDSTTHVPLLVKLPRGEHRGHLVQAQVRTVDILPTVLDWLGIPMPRRLDGESLKPYLADISQDDRPVFGRSDYPLNFGWAPLQSVRTGGFKFIEAPRPELYDLRVDPGEVKNVYEPWSATVQKCRQMLWEARAKSSSPPSGDTAAPATLAELQALGYWSPAERRTVTNVPERSLLPDPKDRVEELKLIEAAELAGRDGRPVDARLALTKLLQMNPGSAPALMQLGQIESLAGDSWKADQYRGLARQVQEADAATICRYGEDQEKTGDLLGARDAFEASVNLDPDRLSSRLRLGETYLRLGDPKAAEKQFSLVVAKQPNSMEAQLDLAKARLAGANYEDAILQLKPLALSYPADADIFDLMAAALSALGKEDEARMAADKATLLRRAK